MLFPSQCGFCKGNNVKNCFHVILENFNEFVDKNNEFGALLNDTSKAFNSIDHRFLILVWSLSFIT